MSSVAQAEEEDQDKGPAYNITLSGPGTEITRKVSEAVALAVINVLMDGGGLIPFAGQATLHAGSSSSGTPTRPPAGPTRRSLREYMDETQPKRYPEKIVTIAQWLLEESGRDTFTRDELKSHFRLAGEAVPANYSRDFNLAVSSGWIAEDRGTGAYYVTQRGRDAIAQQFSAEARKAPSVRRPRRRTRKVDGENHGGES